MQAKSTPKPPCSVAGCDTPAHQRGYCKKHYQRWYRYGDPVAVRQRGHCPRPLAERFWEKVDRSGGPDACWIWAAGVGSHGYGMFGIGHDRTDVAHRVSYRLVNGEIPDGFEVDHLCRNPRCVNPAHLEAVTPQVNTLRSSGPSAQHAVKAHCVHGHPLSGDNLILERRGYRIVRRCRTCRDEKNRRANERRKEHHHADHVPSN